MDKFHITISKSRRLYPCKDMIDQQKRGLFGFHNFNECNNCTRLFVGWELWGQNGHKQGHVPADCYGFPTIEKYIEYLAKLRPKCRYSFSKDTITWY